MRLFLPLLLTLLLSFAASPALARDMRRLQIRARMTKQALRQRAAAEKAAALEEAKKSQAQIVKTRGPLLEDIAALESRNRILTGELRTLTKEQLLLDKEERRLNRRVSDTDRVIRELAGVIRTNAKEIDQLVAKNLQTALDSSATPLFPALADEEGSPSMGSMYRLRDALWKQIARAGEVTRQKGAIVDRAGRKVEAELLLLGPFTAAYRKGQDVGFLSYAPSENKLYALPRRPSSRRQKQIVRYIEGHSDVVPMDITHGDALRQLTYQLSLQQQIQKGGVIVWPILAILVVGLLIVLERSVFLLRKRLDADSLIDQIAIKGQKNEWSLCEQQCAEQHSKPIAHVIHAGLRFRHMEREEIENALQEAILKEIPPMERFLSTLGILAAIAPLLGLLGTVTGMIDTFQVITLHGTGDPRLMSGGISEALITTMLGLSVAIPLMLSHTLLDRAVERRIGEMEEKAVALINIIHKCRVTG